MRLFEIDQEKAREELANLKLSATNAFQKVRDFIFDLRPMMLDDLGVIPTVRRYVDALQRHPGQDIVLEVVGIERRLESYLEVLLFRSIQELVGNALKHSQSSKIKIYIDFGDINIKAVVEDNGKGFDPSISSEQKYRGIRLVRERVEILGGIFDMDSSLGKGTKISFQIPARVLPNLT
jgi:two-component system sensor histidine kinase DegS